MIKGWTEALKLMKVGSKYQLFIPSDLAYCERGAGADIGPDSTLLFDVELLAIEPPAPPAPKSSATYDSKRPEGQPGAANVVKPAASPAATPAASPKAP